MPLSPDVLDVLRDWWKCTHSRLWIFPGHGDGSRPITDTTAQKWYHAARADAGIRKPGGIHLLRHCYATHMLEAGVDIYTLSRWLGHNHVSTTSRYLHLARPDAPDGAKRDPLQLLSALPPLPAPASAGVAGRPAKARGRTRKQTEDSAPPSPPSTH